MRSLPVLLTLLSLSLPSPDVMAADPAAAPATTPGEAATESAPSPSVAPGDRKSSPSPQQWTQWLSPRLPPHEVEWLHDKQVFSLYFPQQLAQARGSVLLVPAKGQHAAWPDHIRALSEQLPPNGWSVLIVTPIDEAPAPAAPAQPTATTPAQSAAEVDESTLPPPAAVTEPDATATPTDSIDMIDVLQAGVALLETKGQKNTIVIGMGAGGMAAVDLAHKNMGTGGSVKGLVLADLPTLVKPSQKLSEIFRLHPIMVLDIAHPQASDALRQRAAQLKQFPQYYAVQLPEPMASIQHSNDRFARRVRGWLTRYVSGEQFSGEQKSGPQPGTPASTAGKP